MAIIAWLVVLVQIVVAWIAWRRPSSIPLVPLMNLIVALCVLGYWVQRWYSYVFKGITWYATDQLVPAYALMALVIAALAISGRLSAPLPNWLIFGIDAIVIVAAALFFTFVRIDRLI